MGLKRKTFFCAFWWFLLFHSSFGFQIGSDDATSKLLQDGISEQRGRHRLQLLFPLLLRISTRLATLVPTALMSLLGIIAFVVFSKKALIVSLFALFLTLSKYNTKNDEIYIHKVSSYPEYNNEEHIHYLHHGPPKYKQVYYGGHPPKWRKFIKRTDPAVLKKMPWHCHDNVLPSKPLSGFEKFLNIVGDNSVPDEIFDEEWNSRQRNFKLCHF